MNWLAGLLAVGAILVVGLTVMCWAHWQDLMDELDRYDEEEERRRRERLGDPRRRPPQR